MFYQLTFFVVFKSNEYFSRHERLKSYVANFRSIVRALLRAPVWC